MKRLQMNHSDALRLESSGMSYEEYARNIHRMRLMSANTTVCFRYISRKMGRF